MDASAGQQEILGFPKQHGGAHYMEVLAQLSRQRAIKRYLEIGVFRGTAFSRIAADVAIGVDPNFKIDQNIAANKRSVRLFQMGSDAFFRDVDAVAELGGHPDLCFLDGMHLFEYLLRDFYKTERISSRNTVICLHDCLPLNAEMAHRNEAVSYELGSSTPYAQWWTGDVWKIVPLLMKYRPDLRVMLLDAPPTGLVCITNLDPDNTVLEKNYLDIVREFYLMPNDESAILNHYKSAPIIRTGDVLNDFNHSLFFNT